MSLWLATFKSQLVGLKRVALREITGLQPFGEPTQSLFAGSVAECFGLDVTPAAFL